MRDGAIKVYLTFNLVNTKIAVIYIEHLSKQIICKLLIEYSIINLIRMERVSF